jgi:DNA primase catalytic core
MKLDFDHIKRTTDLVRVVESYGVKLKKTGRNYVGRCCFHEDKTPSLIITPDKGLFHCPACGAAGNVIQFVARKEKITDREAALKLCQSIPGVKLASASAQAQPAKPTLSAAETTRLLQRVVSFYAKTLHKDRAGLDYLKSRKLDDPTLLEVFQVGYSNGTLPGVLPQAGEIIDGLKALGVLNQKGQEHFRGCVTVPLFDAAGNVTGIYGRQAEPAPTMPHHLYLPGPRHGLWNGTAAKTSQTLFIAEAILDGMALWQAGFKNVVAIYGTNGWTADHDQLLKDNGTTELFLCLDNDEAGKKGTEQLKEKLLAEGHGVKAVHVVQWPEGVKDANDFFLSRAPADFEALLQAVKPQAPPVSEHTTKAGLEQITVTSDGFTAAYGPRRYELRAIEKPGPSRLKATIRATGDQGRFVIDTVDFYLSRSRRSFMSEAARLFKETVDTIETDVNRLIEQLEAYIQKRQTESTSTVAVVSDTDKAEGLKLGRQPDLTGELLRDMERLGMIGETANKLIGYLVMTSRKLADPLALLILSGSGAGKSHLQDTVLSFCPDEDLIKLTSLTDRALFYKGEDSLRHKVLAVEELAGAQGADYAIRNLISAKKLVIESTIKNPLTGKLETQVNTVHGPTSVFQTTTNPRTDAETRSRFILVSVDESAEQTRAILQAQRQSHTLEGWRHRQAREAILRRHHAFQRLLKPVVVVNPFEPFLSYPNEQLLVRRDHPKYLHLILAVTFLHQLQRPIRHDPALGDYIETSLDDIAIANDLAHQLFGHSLDDLSQPSRQLLSLIADHVAKKAAGGSTDKVSFNRRELRESFKWGDTRLRIHLEELVEMEYVVPLSGRFGQTYQYRLLYTPTDEPGRFLAGLKSVEQLRREANLAGGMTGGPCGTHLAPQKGDLAPTSQVPRCEVQNPVLSNKDEAFVNPPANLAPFGGERISNLQKPRVNGALVSVSTGGDL